MRKLGLLLLLGVSSAMSESTDGLIQILESQLIERGVEFNSTEYPISTEVWEINDNGIEAVGAFPEN